MTINFTSCNLVIKVCEQTALLRSSKPTPQRCRTERTNAVWGDVGLIVFIPANPNGQE